MKRKSLLLISDIHAGSLLFDLPALFVVLRKMEKMRVKVSEIHLLGDILEGGINYSTQPYTTLPHTLQISLAKGIILRMVDITGAKKIHILPGNHDRKHINLLDKLILKLKEHENIEVVYYEENDYYERGNMLLLHGINTTSGSDYTVLTPNILNNILSMMLVNNLINNVKYIVLGHYHKFSVHSVGDKIIITLPSFQYSTKYAREQRGIVLFKPSNPPVIIPVLVNPSRREEVVKQWEKYISKIIHNNNNNESRNRNKR